ncbi:homeobox-like domain superfamily [Holotrichia oblita]|uniref:Homeobox-like domain superfamily n=1 Tax=Holotrichia oblita TaxID=644536 RepID=A0ACB9THF0_HOLOL|nr:homeobox-like domain superfamily [Holotrichia oblita]
MSKRAKWTEDTMRIALEEVHNGQPVLAVAKQYGIPRRTLRNHIRIGRIHRQLGRHSLLNVAQENELCRRIFRLAEVGMPLTPKVLRRSLNGLKQPFSIQNRLAGRKWMALFYRRHPEVARRKSQMLNPARAQKLNRPIVTEYFGKLKQILMDLNIMNQPQRIYNMDEKGCRLTLHHQQQVLSRKGAKRVHLIAPEHSESATVVTCGNALGQCGPESIRCRRAHQ